MIMEQHNWQNDLVYLRKGTESPAIMPTLIQSRAVSLWRCLISRNSKSNPFIYVYVNSSLNTSEEGTFRRTSLPLNPCTNDFGILKICLPVIKKSESLSIEIIFSISSLSLERTPFNTSLSQFWIISGILHNDN